MGRAVDAIGRDRLAADPRLLHAVAAVTGASRFLTRLLLADPAAVDMLRDLDHRPALGAASDADALARWKRHELLRIAARDLTGADRLEAVGLNLTELADDVLAAAWRLAGRPPLAVIA